MASEDAERSAYLIVRTQAPHGRFLSFCDVVGDGGGRLVAARPANRIDVLEPGSSPLHTWIGLFPSMQAAKAAWAAMDAGLLAAPAPPLVLAAHAVPKEGYPDDAIPTHLNVSRGPAQPPTLMLIEGSAGDQAAMDRYRDIILPMMKSLGAYYIVFELGGDVEVLSGDWDEAIFAVSRWPSADAARAFWFSDMYQYDAIPLRLHISAFQVVTMDGERDR